MKKFATLSVIAGAVFLSLSPAKADIRIGVMNEPYPPLFWKDASGKWQGWSIEVMGAVCAEIKENCTIVDMSWDGLIPALLAKKFDVIWSDMSITDERKKVITFTDPYEKGPQMIVGAKDGKLGTAPDDLAGKTLGIQVSTIQEKYFKKFYAEKSSIKIYQTQDEANQDLAAGRIDYVFAGAPAMLAFLKTDIGQACCESKGNVKYDTSIFGYGTGGGLRKEDTELLKKLDEGIAGVMKSGEYKKISDKYFSYDPMGGE
jgi:polar amino acid transport system substrate-binding protein